MKSVVFALRPAGISGAQGGVFDTEDPKHRLEFDYRVIRVWELPPARVLSGGIGTLPLAPISAVSEAQLPAVIDAVARRFEAEAPATTVPDLWAVTEILMGIRWPSGLIHQLMRGARQMKDSVIYQEILDEGIEKGIEKGRVAEARLLLLRHGSKKLGVPDTLVQSQLAAIDDLAKLEQLTDRALDGTAVSWAELLSSLG
jgi:predicted transposase YdaD